MSLIVRRPGACSLFVDQGRPGSLHHGIPQGGPADRTAWLLGNALVGNVDAGSNLTALEIAFQGPTLEATARHTLVVFGASFQILHRRAGLPQSTSIPIGHVFTVENGDEIMIGGNNSNAGLRAYLCVAGGFSAPMLLESQSSLDPVQPGETLPCEATEQRQRQRWIRPETWQEYLPGNRLRLIAGTHLSKKWKALLEDTKFTVRPESNRMGLRLNSSVTWPTDGKELLSAPVVPGTLQLPAGGQPILLGVDAQTIGGYPRLGHIIHADFDRVGQLKPGDFVRFAVVPLEDAERLEKLRTLWLRSWLERIRWSA